MDHIAITVPYIYVRKIGMLQMTALNSYDIFQILLKYLVKCIEITKYLSLNLCEGEKFRRNLRSHTGVTGGHRD